MNESIRAWNLLKPEERPEGMTRDSVGFGQGLGRIDDFMTDATARDRLIVAVGNVNQKQYGLAGVWFETEWQWWKMDAPNNKWTPVCKHADQLKAANDALEAIRKATNA